MKTEAMKAGIHREEWMDGCRKLQRHRDRRTDVVRIKLIHAHERREAQNRLGHIFNNRELARV